MLSSLNKKKSQGPGIDIQHRREDSKTVKIPTKEELLVQNQSGSRGVSRDEVRTVITPSTRGVLPQQQSTGSTKREVIIPDRVGGSNSSKTPSRRMGDDRVQYVTSSSSSRRSSEDSQPLRRTSDGDVIPPMVKKTKLSESDKVVEEQAREILIGCKHN